METWFAAALVAASLIPCLGAAADVRQFGAKGDGLAKDTVAIQAAIDATERQGGGTVLVPAGKYLSGTIHLKNNVTLHLENGAVLLASPDNADFDPYEKLPFESVSDRETTYFHYALIAAENVQHIAIEGRGTVDGNRSQRGGPKTIAIKLCQHVGIRGITVQNSPNYSISFWGTDDIDVDGVTILNGYADGIDPDACRYVRIANCNIDSHDDAICPKASPSMGMENKRSVEYLTVSNCVLRTDASCFKFGTESTGDFRHIAVTNCTMGPRASGKRPNNGIALASVDGGNIDGVVISNIEMSGLEAPIFIRLGNRGRGLSPRTPGTVENISIQNVVARDCSMTSSITGLPGHPVRRVQLNGITLSMTGGASEPRDLTVPEQEAVYPQGRMFGLLPSYGVYGRHAEEITLTNVHTRWEKQDLRPAMLFDDVKDLSIDSFRTDTIADPAPALWFHNVAGAFVHGGRIPPAQTFLRISGAASQKITTRDNDVYGAKIESRP